MLIRAIAPDWLNQEWKEKGLDLPAVKEGDYADEVIKSLNATGYGIFILPNCPRRSRTNWPVSAFQSRASLWSPIASTL